MANNGKKVCVPIMERESNEVDELEARIRKIQANCDHDFRLIEEPELRETRVSGVFMGKVRIFGAPRMTLVCLKCNKAKETNILEICPRCLGSMKRGECLGAVSREKYFEGGSSFSSITLYYCPNCNFTVASDE